MKTRTGSARPEAGQARVGTWREVATAAVSPACHAASSIRPRTARSDWVLQTALLIVFFFTFTLQGCATQSTLARYIVNPGKNETPTLMMFKKLAQPFYSQVGEIRSDHDNATVISYAVIEPRDYDFSIAFSRNSDKYVIKLYLYIHDVKKLGLGIKSLEVAAAASNPSNYAARRLLPKWIAGLPSSKPIGTVIMFPGYGESKYSLLPGALLFSKMGWRVVLVDLRGQGSVSARYMTWGIRDREDIFRLQDELNAQGLIKSPVVYMGVSYGAGIALMSAAGNSSVSGVIAVAPWESAETVIPRFACWAAHANWLISRMICHISPSKWEKAEQIAGNEAGVNLNLAKPLSYMPFIKSPVLLIGGNDDAVATPSAIDRLARRSVNAQVVILPEMGHFAISSNIPALCPSITKWINLIAGINHVTSLCHNISVQHIKYKYNARFVITIVQRRHASVFDFLRMIF